MEESRVAIFVGSTMGDSLAAAEEIAFRLGQELHREIPIFDVAGLDLSRMLDYDLLIMGCSTWNIGELQVDWDWQLDDLKELDLEGRYVALFGSGDQRSYDDTFQDAIGIIAEIVEDAGATLLGSWPAEGYLHVESKGQRGDHFVGLALDYDNQAELSEDRIARWSRKLAQEWLALGSPTDAA